MNNRTTNTDARRRFSWPWLVVATMACTSIAGAVAPRVAHAALQEVASYQMNEGSTATVLVDSSPFGLDGTIGSDIETDFQYDSATGHRWPFTQPDTGAVRPQRLSIVETDALLNPGTSTFAVEVRYRTTRDFGNIVQKGQSPTQGGYWKVEQPNGFPTCLFRSSMSDQAGVTSPFRTNDGDWHTIRCVREATRVRMFVDGVQVDSRKASVGRIANGFELTIGGKLSCNQASVGCDYFTGQIDYVTIDKDLPAQPNDPPVVSMTASCNGLDCSFDSSASTDDDGTIVDRVWSFGDGWVQTLYPAATEHTYATSGTYEVELVATDDDGASASTSTTLSVIAPAGGGGGGGSGGGSDGSLASASKFVPLTPTRIVDTRPGELPATPKGVVEAGTSLTVQVSCRGGVPATGVTAVAINVTGIGIDAPGHISVGPGTTADSSTSSINLPTPGQARANLVIVPVGSAGTISIFTLSDAHIIGDIAGYFTAQTTPSAEGRMVAFSPQRLFDTRTASIVGPRRRVAAGGTISVVLVGHGGVPSYGVGALVLNVTATQPDGAGFVTVWPGNTPRPPTSSLNVNRPGETGVNQVIVPVAEDGVVQFLSTTEVDLVVDVVGYVTDVGASVKVSGLFVPLTPARVFDTRAAEAAPGPKGTVAGGTTIDPMFGGVAGIPADAGAVVTNITLIGTGAGHATLWPTGATKPSTSNVNVDAVGDVRANGAIVRLGTGGRIDVSVITAADVLADVFGYLIA